MGRSLKLGVNIDHVVTLRQARYARMVDSANAEPSLLEAVHEVEEVGADSITAHLRADRRHIQDADVFLLREHIRTKLNFEMGNTPEIVEIALEVCPDFVCLVPEHREEITTEGGLDVVGQFDELEETVERMQSASIQVSMFIDPVPEQIEASARIGADIVELHTGAFANASGLARTAEVGRLRDGAKLAHEAGLQVNAGHGITTKNLGQLFEVPHLAELNIGHHIVSRSVIVGIREAVREMLDLMESYS